MIPVNTIPRADTGFLEIFLPYELRLAQRRAMVWGSLESEFLPNAFVGLYLMRFEAAEGEGGDIPAADAERVMEHGWEILTAVLRDSDIPARLEEREFLAVLRDIDPEHAYVVAQRLLGLVARSELLREKGIRTRVGYLVYPFSFQPNFPAESWRELVEIARRMSARGGTRALASGHGILRGPRIVETSITEADLVALVQQDSESLVKAGLLQMQRIHMGEQQV